MMSSKSNRMSSSRIVETNASGIVTIVIEDDYYRPIDDNNDSNDPNSSDIFSMSSPTPNRPAIGVQTPVPPLGSPKFINSENYQNILIKENKTNVIVVNSSGSDGQSSPTLRSGQTSFSPSSSCCSTQSLAPEVKTKHNIVSKHQTHYIVVNKPKPTEDNCPLLTSSSFTSSPSSPSFTSKSSPTKLRLWTQSANQSTPRTPQVIVSTRSRSHTSLPPEDVESDCMDDQTFFKYLNLISSDDILNKPKISLQTTWPLRKVSKILKPAVDHNGRLILANFKSIREPIKPVPELGKYLAERKLLWYREAQQYNSKLQKFKANLPTNPQVKEKIQSDLEGVHKRLMNEKQELNVKEEKYRRMKTLEQNQILQRQELRQELENYSNAFEMSSLMGRRVMVSSDTSCLSTLEIFNMNLKYEMYCNSKDLQSISAPQMAKTSTRITRSNTGFAGIDKMWGPRSEAHVYCFSRRERLERYQRLETGLNWKSRLIKKHCRPIDVEVSKITRCPCCLEIVEPEWGHSCQDSDDEFIPEEISSINDSEFGVQSENTFNDEEIVSTNSEIITTGNVVCFDCGEEDCNGFCMAMPETTVTQIDIKDITLPVKVEIEDKIMVNRVPVLHYKCNNNNNKTIIENKNNGKSDSISVKRSLGLNIDKKAEEVNDSDDDIVIINEVRDSRSRSESKRAAEPVVITRFLPQTADTKPSIKRNFFNTRLRSQSRSETEEIIVKKIKY